jgi:signal peptidase I
MFFYPMFVRILTSRPYKIEGNSMLPTLADGQYALVTPVSSTSRPLIRGEIVVHLHPMGLAGIYVKRVVGLPDEHVKLESGEIYIDDVLLAESLPDSDTDLSDPPITEWWNGSNEYVVMGDNRRESHDDSRAFGAVSRERILGRAWLRYWPPKAWGIL